MPEGNFAEKRLQQEARQLCWGLFVRASTLLKPDLSNIALVPHLAITPPPEPSPLEGEGWEWGA